IEDRRAFVLRQSSLWPNIHCDGSIFVNRPFLLPFFKSPIETHLIIPLGCFNSAVRTSEVHKSVIPSGPTSTSAAWASPWRWSSDEFEDGLAHGGQCRSRRRLVDSFFPALLF